MKYFLHVHVFVARSALREPGHFLNTMCKVKIAGDKPNMPGDFLYIMYNDVSKGL